MPLPLAAASLALSGLETVYGLYQANNLNDQPLPLPVVTPELRNAYGRAESMANQGYTPQEAAAFKSNLSRANTLSYRNAVNMAGGSLAGALNKGVQANNLGALNTFASNDAGLRRSNMRYADSLASHIQSISNARQQALMNRRNQAEQAAGGALRTGLTGLGSTLNMNQAMNFYNNLYGVKDSGAPSAGTQAQSRSSSSQQPFSMPAINSGQTLIDIPNYGQGAYNWNG